MTQPVNTPIKINDGYMLDVDHRIITIMNGLSTDQMTFICKAVNNYDALVKALKNIRDYLVFIHDRPVKVSTIKAIKQIDKLLSNLEEK